MLQTNQTQKNIRNQDTTNRTQVSSITVFPVSGVLSGNKHSNKKEYMKKYIQRPEVKERMKEYHNRELVLKAHSYLTKSI